MSGSRIPAALRDRLGPEATFGLIELFDGERNDWSERVLSTAADQFERRLTEEMSALRQEIASVRVDWLKWSFAFWLGQIAATASLLAYMLRGMAR